MNKYLIEIWFRLGKFEKDFEQVEIEADNKDEAYSIARDLRSRVYMIKTLKINGINTSEA